MTTVFLGGSRAISRLSSETKERLKNIMDSEFDVIVGDANGADKAIQKYMADASYGKLTVFCSGKRPRNNIGHWPVHAVVPSKSAGGFEYYAAKDREMARTADYGLMVWDGRSAGTVLNILRLVRAGKKAVLINVPKKNASTFKLATDWECFIRSCPTELISDLRKRATSEEWLASAENAVETNNVETALNQIRNYDALTAAINNAFEKEDLTTVIDLVGSFARSRGMATIAKNAGLSRESLYRSLSAEGNPEFSTIMKVLTSLGLRLSVSRTSAGPVKLTMHTG